MPASFKDIARELVAAGCSFDTKAGKGSHIKVLDPAGNFITVLANHGKKSEWTNSHISKLARALDEHLVEFDTDEFIARVTGRPQKAKDAAGAE